MTPFREQFGKLCELLEERGEYDVEVRKFADEMLAPIISAAQMKTAIRYYTEGREDEVPEHLKNDALRDLRKRKIGFTANIDD